MPVISKLKIGQKVKFNYRDKRWCKATVVALHSVDNFVLVRLEGNIDTDDIFSTWWAFKGSRIIDFGEEEWRKQNNIYAAAQLEPNVYYQWGNENDLILLNNTIMETE